MPHPARRPLRLASILCGSLVCLGVLPGLGPASAGESAAPTAVDTPPAVMDAEPGLCREAIAAFPGEEIEALRKAETKRWQAARHASREGKRLMRQSLGAGTTPGSRRLYEEIARSQASYMQAVREAKVICVCREKRGDPNRQDCEALYRGLEGGAGARPMP